MKKLVFMSLLLCTSVTWATPKEQNAATASPPSLMKIEKAPPPKPTPDEGKTELEKNMMQSTEQDESQTASSPSVLRFFYSDSRSLSTYMGAAYLGNNGVTYGLAGLSYTLESDSRFHFEAAYESIGAQESHFRFMGKWFAKISEKFRPYSNIGLGVRILSMDNIAVILSWSRYFLQVGGGAEWSFTQHLSLRAECFLAGDANANTYLGALAGLSIGF